MDHGVVVKIHVDEFEIVRHGLRVHVPIQFISEFVRFVVELNGHFDFGMIGFARREQKRRAANQKRSDEYGKNSGNFFA